MSISTLRAYFYGISKNQIAFFQEAGYGARLSGSSRPPNSVEVIDGIEREIK